MFTIVVYIKRRFKKVVLYVGRSTFVFTTTAEIKGRVRKRWRVGKTEAFSARVRGEAITPLLHGDEKACKKISLLDPVFREAARNGYQVHRNIYFVELWLSKPLGEPLGRIDQIDERELGVCIKCFTHSYGLWRIVTPPWCCVC
ncbi:MAG: hypothetical protein ACO2PN_17490 [Pyrobaculum sp.]|jgi:hypothetical protein